MNIPILGETCHCRIPDRNSQFLGIPLCMFPRVFAFRACTEEWRGMDCSYLDRNPMLSLELHDLSTTCLYRSTRMCDIQSSVKYLWIHPPSVQSLLLTIIFIPSKKMSNRSLLLSMNDFIVSSHSLSSGK